jgi:hypothetical protein
MYAGYINITKEINRYLRKGMYYISVYNTPSKETIYGFNQLEVGLDNPSVIATRDVVRHAFSKGLIDVQTTNVYRVTKVNDLTSDQVGTLPILVKSTIDNAIA